MDFKSIKSKLWVLKDNAEKYAKKAVENTAESFAKSGMVLNNDKSGDKFAALDKFLEKNKRVIVIFGEENTAFYKDIMIKMPVLYTKSFAQNFQFKIFGVNKEDSLEKLKIEKLPSMVIYKKWEISEVIEWEEKIMELVKKMSLDVENVVNK